MRCRLKKLTGLREYARLVLYCIRWCTYYYVTCGMCTDCITAKKKYAESSKDGVRIGFRYPDGHKTFHCSYPSDATKVS